jgi:hypothetical protein
MRSVATWLFVAAAFVSACGGAGAPGSGDGSFPATPLVTLSSETSKLVIEVRTAPDQPPQRGVASVELVVKVEGAPQDGLDVMSTPWMPAMGHGTSVTPTVTAKGNGTYVLDNVYLYMPGHWELRTSFSGSVSDSATPSFDVP